MKKATEIATIKAPKFEIIKIQVKGSAPLVMNKFSEKAKRMMQDAQEAGSTVKKSKKQNRETKNFF